MSLSASIADLKPAKHWSDYVIGRSEELIVRGVRSNPLPWRIRSRVPEGSGTEFIGCARSGVGLRSAPGQEFRSSSRSRSLPARGDRFCRECRAESWISSSPFSAAITPRSDRLPQPRISAGRNSRKCEHHRREFHGEARARRVRLPEPRRGMRASRWKHPAALSRSQSLRDATPAEAGKDADAASRDAAGKAHRDRRIARVELFVARRGRR